MIHTAPQDTTDPFPHVQEQAEKELSAMLLEIANFYEDPPSALRILKEHFDKMIRERSGDPNTKAKRLLRTEKAMYGKRLVNHVRRNIELLKIALDESPIRPPLTGNSLGIAAYQAESRYTGKSNL